MLSLWSLLPVAVEAAKANDNKTGPKHGRNLASAGRAWQTVYHEHEFKRARHLTAKPDSLVVIDLEPRRRGNPAPADSGRPGVDSIPLEFTEKMERQFCWEGSALLDAHPGAMPHQFELRDSRKRKVVSLREGGNCVTAKIKPGRYLATFRAGSGRGDEPSKIFMRPAAMFAGAADGPPEDIDPSMGPGDLDSSSSCALPLTTPVSSNDAAGISASLKQGEIALFFDSSDSSNYNQHYYLTLPSSCSYLSFLESINLQQVKTPLGLRYRLSIFPAQGHTVALYYTRENFLGPRIQVPDSCICRQSNCSDCSASSPTFLDPLHVFFECARRLQDGFECNLPPEVTLKSSLSLLDPNAQNGNILISTNKCENCDFRHSSALSGQNLSGVDVRSSDFSNADLSGTILDGADARNAIFDSVLTTKPVSMVGAKLSGARFGYERTLIPDTLEAVFNHAAQLRGADFSNSDLTAATFPRARLSGAKFVGANLTDVKMRLAGLSSLLPPAEEITYCEPAATSACDDLDPSTNCAANMDGVTGVRLDLRGAQMAGVSLRSANLSDALIEGVEAYGADFGRNTSNVSTRLDGTQFDGSGLRCANFDHAAGTSTDFTKARMNYAYLGNAALPRAILTETQLAPANLGNANLSDAFLAGSADGSLSAANLDNAYMFNAVLDGAVLSGATLSNVSWYSYASCTGSCASAQGAVLSGTDLTCARLPHLNFSDAASMRGVTLTAASLGGANISAGSNVVDLGPDGDNKSMLNGADLRAANLSGAALIAANLRGALVLSSTRSPFGVWAAADPGHYQSALVPPASGACGAAADIRWQCQQNCVSVTGSLTSTPIVTTGGTTCPDNSQTTQTVGCGQIVPENPSWNPVPTPQPPIADCSLQADPDCSGL
jgi:uncharacterized protein YjbI with pentapeptide repeats